MSENTIDVAHEAPKQVSEDATKETTTESPKQKIHVKVELKDKSKHCESMKKYYLKNKHNSKLCAVCNKHVTFSNGSNHKRTALHQSNLIIYQLKEKLANATKDEAEKKE